MDYKGKQRSCLTFIMIGYYNGNFHSIGLVDSNYTIFGKDNLSFFYDNQSDLQEITKLVSVILMK